MKMISVILAVILLSAHVESGEGCQCLFRERLRLDVELPIALALEQSLFPIYRYSYNGTNHARFLQILSFERDLAFQVSRAPSMCPIQVSIF